MKNAESEIVAKWQMDKNELYSELGFEVTNSMFNKDPEKLIAIGKEWFDSKFKLFKFQLCEDAKIKILISKEQNVQNRINLILAISDYLISLKLGVSPISVSVLIVKEGVSKICA